MNNLFFVIFGALIIALFAQLSWNPNIAGAEIPITGQTFAVLVVSYVFPGRLGFHAVLLYIFLGAIGLPVFAEYSGGWLIVVGKTAGYIFGFLAASFYISSLKARAQHSFRKIVLVHAMGTLMILILGYAMLSYCIGSDTAWQYGIAPFIPGAILKILLGAWVSKLLIQKSAQALA